MMSYLGGAEYLEEQRIMKSMQWVKTILRNWELVIVIL